jgi:hypothetical protein
LTTDLTTKPQFMDLPQAYDGKALRQPWSDILIEGVVGINDYLVVPKGGTAASPDAGGASRNRSVDILMLANAAAWVLGDDTPNTQGITRQLGGATTFNEALNTNTSGSARIDLVCLKIDYAAMKGQTTIVQGTPGAGAPALPANHLKLAEVTCVDSYTLIAAAQIADKRSRAFRPVFEVFPGADVNAITSSAWTDICTLPNIVTANDRTATYEFEAKLQSTGAGIPGCSLQVIDTAQGNAVVAAMGLHKLDATGGADEIVIARSISKPLAAGSHTFKLQAWKNANGVVNVIKTETLSTARAVTRLAVLL